MRRSSGFLRDHFGCPRLLYHGTNRQIDRFEVGASRRRAAYFGDGIYFTDSAWQASSYAGDGEGANVIPVYLLLANPFVEGVSPFNGGRALVATELRSDLILKTYEKAGHDGVILTRGWVIAFTPEQIHFAIGSHLSTVAAQAMPASSFDAMLAPAPGRLETLMSSIEVTDYAAGIGTNDAKEARCVILSPDGVPEGGLRVATARSAYLQGDDLCLDAPAGLLVLKSLKPALKEALSKGLPLIAVDPARQLDRRIELVAAPDGAAAPAPRGGLTLPPGFFG